MLTSAHRQLRTDHPHIRMTGRPRHGNAFPRTAGLGVRASRHRGQGGGDLLVAALRGVLVPQRGVDAAVAESLLELRERAPPAPPSWRRCGGGRAREGPGGRPPRGPSASAGASSTAAGARRRRAPGRGERRDPAPSSCRGGGRSQGRRAAGWRPPASPPPTSASPRWARHRPRTPRGRPAPSPPRRRRPCGAARAPRHCAARTTRTAAPAHGSGSGMASTITGELLDGRRADLPGPRSVRAPHGYGTGCCRSPRQRPPCS